MRALENTFRRLQGRGEAALIGYVTVGDPKPEWTPEIVEALIDGGTDIIELGIPFSDPIADGPTIQAASVRALREGTTPNVALSIAKEVKDRYPNPVVMLTYYNPIYRMGLEAFLKDAKSCRVDGLVVPDLPVEEAQEYRAVAQANGIDTVFLAAPSTSTERLQNIVAQTTGFLYLVSTFGVTGTREKVQSSTLQLIKKTLEFTRGHVPLAVGFGISKPEHVKSVIDSGVDGAIVGSAFVNVVHRNRQDIKRMLKEIEGAARELKQATERG